MRPTDVTDLPTFSADPKRARVLDAAARTFLAYGFQRTTMEDIARAAEMSRPALYLLFRNKTEIYRAIAAVYIDVAIADASARLTGDGTLAARIVDMFEGSLIAIQETFAASPHGMEMLDMKGDIAGDLIAAWRAAVTAALAGAIEREEAASGNARRDPDLAPAALAATVIDGFEGAKMRSADASELRATARRLASLVEIVLSRGRDGA